MFQRILQNHVLANLMFALVLVLGTASYLIIPRAQDPSINFNWININTIWPGASTPDVEKQITNVIEDAVRKVSDIEFVSSASREGVSSLLIRFHEISGRTFEKRVSDLRREIEGIRGELPETAFDPFIFEITSDNALPTATVVVSSVADDENLRRQSALIRQDLEQLKGVSNVFQNGLSDPEIHIVFKPELLEQFALGPADIADTIRLYFRNISAGTLDVAQSNWAIRISGSRYDLDYLNNLPIITLQGEVLLKEVADVIQAREPATQLVRFNGQPSVLFTINKREKQNILQLVDRISTYIDDNRVLFKNTGVTVTLVDDQTQITRDAISTMQANATLGLIMVLAVTWIFLGAPIALLTGIAIPFILAGVFWVLNSIGQTLNVTVLLGIVISLGMLVDDAVVVVEAIYYRLQRGAATLQAAIEGLQEVIRPVTTSVLTTIAAFLPLALLPGILGQFLRVIPVVVITALIISLIEAYWLLPAHIIAAKVNFRRYSRLHQVREKMQYSLRHVYVRTLIRVLRHPIIALLALFTLFCAALGAVYYEKIKVDFFVSDPIRLFYISIEMPAGTELHTTMDKVLQVEQIVKGEIKPGEIRSVVSYAGQLLTDTEIMFSKQYGQILVSLKPKDEANRSMDELIDSLQGKLAEVPGIETLSFLRLSGGPPVTRAISVKVRGNDLDKLIDASAEIRQFMEREPIFRDISDTNLPGQKTLNLQINSAAVQRTGIAPNTIGKTLRLLVDGEIVTSLRYLGEKINIRLIAENDLSQIGEILQYRLPAKDGKLVALSQLVDTVYTNSPDTIRHFNYRRNITIEADIYKEMTDELKANQRIREFWESIRHRYPNIDLDFSGIIDDIQESLNAIGLSFLMGLGLIYLILGAQFRSYFQPFLIILTIPMAATGVVLGLLVNQYPLSLFSLYGIVALAGIAVNAAIVLISTANARLHSGMSVTNAIIYASRRRVIPILITSLTTIAGLFSLATGLGGKSLLWGPVAASMVWGLTLSTPLTLFYIPLFFHLFMRPWKFRLCRTQGGAGGPYAENNSPDLRDIRFSSITKPVDQQ